MKRTWYVVQTGRRSYVEGLAASGWIVETPEIDSASQYRLSEARRVFRDVRASVKGGTEGASRFPRIIKVTQETKTIKEG